MQTPKARWQALLFGLIAANLLPETLLQLADAGWFGVGYWRLTAYSYGGLWRGLLAGWQPNFTGQPALMFLTYGFLHSGAMHLLGNLAAMLWLAPITAREVGARGLALIYAISVLGGGLMFVLLSDSVRPMVGASGGVYGLAAAWIYWEYRDRVSDGLPLGIIWIKLVVLGLTNVLAWWWLAGEIAWQTHVGGSIAAWGCAWALSKPSQPDPNA
ncbi:rhomboid family intramembrane serine protease [Roseobacter cerasinus]|uniref:Rhomboid family intramembrane serine protease n=1 Tax=Roseobacter cerasinus TaxID=2602289 RepID=A0A640VWE5_9RHOB|nr:rhomboid family intramembrane serine protease [Roseobacter cerasinus]GFE52463.1 rhomboid family intramembrane serine protease [Roseobacter cerasinus]